MIRRSPIETKINHERWLVSYADFITLLFAFFVVMYSVSNVDKADYMALSKSLNSSFTNTKASNSEIEGRLDAINESSLAKPEVLSNSILEIFETLGIKDRVVLNGNENWVEVELPSALLFSSGNSTLDQGANDILRPLADLVSRYDNAVSVEGHTDDLPINNENYKSNWALSSDRAIAVLKSLAFNGVAPERLSAIAFGEYRPIASNESVEGREQNRRVVIRIEKDAAELTSVPAVPLRDDSLSDSASQASDDMTAIEPNSSTEVGESPFAGDQDQIEELPVAPVRLRGGGLLFSLDPDLPRVNPPVQTITPDPNSSTEVVPDAS